MVRRRSLLLAAATLALVAVPVLASPVGAASGIDAAAARTYAYWTAERIASAKPRDFNAAGQLVPKARPGGGSGVTGASWTGGGDVVKQTGKVYFSLSGGNWQCSGSFISDSRSGYSTILTAGHCVVDETTGEFATNWVFIPDWDTKPATFSTACNTGATAHGCWAAIGLWAHYGFVHAGSFNNQAVTHDWGFAVVGTGSTGQQLDVALGLNGYGLEYNVISTSTRVQPFGYPAAGKYHGNDLTWCAGNPALDVTTKNNAEQKTWGVACDMTGGSSGGPWFRNLNETNGSGGTVVSLNSYGYSGVKNMYGPNFNTQTQGTLGAAQSGTPTTGGHTYGTAP
jgi:hypothetical protein